MEPVPQPERRPSTEPPPPLAPPSSDADLPDSARSLEVSSLPAVPSFGAGPRPQSTPLAEVLLLATVAALLAPFLAELFGIHLWPGRLQTALEPHFLRQVSGFVGLGLIAIQVALAARKRLGKPSARHMTVWKRVHQLTGLPLLLVILAHTGARVGTNLNVLLLASLVAMMLVAQFGHIFKATVATLAWAASAKPKLRELNESANGETGDVHKTGLLVHVAFAVTVTSLLAVHVFCVYYF
ncbi:MAG TPA: hypothetical protein VM580_18860 [Labilithrix sp.]|nr:hypothetical protein [Labilithrix sp.]